MFNVHKAKDRAVLFGGAGGFLGWILAQIFWGTPVTFLGAVIVGAMAGLGIGALLGVSEGIAAASGELLKRGLIAGVFAGLAGGAAGAFVGQLGFSILSGRPAQASGASQATVFSTDVQQRLAEAGAKSGEIEISLIWENSNDLDLHVIDPNGDRIYFQDRVSASGGELDVDRNASCQSDITTKPIEHVVWTGESAPQGVYQVQVHHYMNCGPPDPTAYRIEVKIGDEIASSHKGELTHNPRQISLLTIIEFTYPMRDTSATGDGGSHFGAIVGRLMGWLVFGLLVGCAEGVKRKSRTSLINAATGGAIGGGIGGLLFQLIASAGLSDSISRLVGFVVLGACIGLLIAIVEQLRSSFLVIENGRFAGREIAIDRPTMRIGRNDALEIFVGGDRSITSHHATIEQQGRAISVASLGGDLQVNGVSTKQMSLKDGDRLRIGETVLAVRSRHHVSSDSGNPPALTSQHSTPPTATIPPSRKLTPPPGKPGTPPPLPQSAESSITPAREPAPAPSRSKLPPPPPRKGGSPQR